MFVACGIWCLADVWSVSPSSEQSLLHIPQATNIPYQPLLIKPIFSVLAHAEKQFFFKSSLQEFILGSTSVELSTQSVGNNDLGSTLGQMLISVCEELNSMNFESTFEVRRLTGRY